MIIDRSQDVPPPADRGATIQCDGCGKRMIGCYDDSRMRETPPVMQWFWWCGCGRQKLGGAWHPKTRDEALMARWADANKQTAA